MKDYTIFTETTGDLDAAFINSGAVRMIPMSMTVGDDERFFAETESDDEIKSVYAEMRSGKTLKTSRISPFVYETTFRPAMAKGDVIYLSFSSGMSPAFASTTELSEQFKNEFRDTVLYSVDSLSGTGGMGIMLERMIANKEKGMSAEENVLDIEAFRKRVHMMAFVEDLTHLKRGGRISATSAAIGSFLNIKPIIQITGEGKLEVFYKCMGEMKAVQFIAGKFRERFEPDTSSPVYITHADNERTAELLASRIRAAFPSANIKTMLLSPIIGVHLGPGSVVISYEMKQ